MIRPTDALSNEELGKRLRIARESKRLTQGDAAKELGISRTTLLAIEQGKRPIRGGELNSAIDLYRVTMNQLLRRDAIHVDLVPRFRKLAERQGPGVESAANLLNVLASAEVELENILGIQRSSNLPPERPLLPGDVRRQAEGDALELRQWMGIGVSPIRDMMALLELELGVRVYLRPLKGSVSGLFAYDDSIGACILVNSLHPFERQAQTLAHELGHIVSTRRRPEIFDENMHQDSREERYANAFGRAFLMPPRTVVHKFHELTAGARSLTRRHVILLSHYFCTSRESVVRTLEDLELAPEGTWDWFLENGGITNEQAEEVLGSSIQEARKNSPSSILASLRLDSLAADVLHRGLLSEGQIAQLLRVDRVSIRKLEDSMEDGENALRQLS